MKRLLSILFCFCIITEIITSLSSCNTSSYIDNQPPTQNTTTTEPTLSKTDYNQPLKSAVPDLSTFIDALDMVHTLSNEYMYTFRPLYTEEDSINANDIFINTNGLINVLSESDKASNIFQFHRYDKYGSYIETISVQTPNCDIGERIKSPILLSDNTLLCTTMVYPDFGAPEDALADLILSSPSGEILAYAELPALYADTIFIMDDGRIAVSTNESVLLYDNTLNLLCEMPIQANLFLENPAGELYAQTGWIGQYSLLHTDTLTSSPMNAYKADNLSNTMTMYFSETESMYDAYFSDDTGLWGVNEGEATATLLCDWLQSGQTYSKLTLHAIFDETTILTGIQDPFTGNTVYGILCRDQTTTEENQEKRSITVGLLGVESSVETHIMEAVSLFNAENSKYFINVMSYSTNKMSTDTIKSDEFEEALLNNTVTDIVISDAKMRPLILNYADKNAFLDLSTGFEQTLLPCAADAYRSVNGALYTIPLHMKISLLAAKEYMLGSDEILSIDRILNLSYMANNEDIALFNEINPADILSVAAPSFANRITGECGFDSQSFADVIQFYEKANKLCTSDDDGIYYAYGDYFVKDSAFAEKWKNDEFLLCGFQFHSIHAYPMMKLFSNQHDFSMHGYPADNGEIVIFSCDADISITADSVSARGAAEFVAFLLSDGVQTYDHVHGLPVTASGLEMLLTKNTYYYSPGLYENYGNDEYFISALHMYDEDTVNQIFPDAITVTITNKDRAAIRKFFSTAHAQTLTDTVMTSIIEEELSAYRAGVRSLAEAQKIMQSRLWIYINE